uniref:Uncharacterized protein n=1 Tax=Anopheles quadriannulatus TaxID=34691 RepID=A0A182XS84_ANOQN
MAQFIRAGAQCSVVL